MDPQAAHGLGQVGVGDGGVDGRIEAAHQRVVLVPGGIVAAEQFAAPAAVGLELARTVALAAFGGQGRGLALQGFAQLEQLVDVVQGDIGDDDAAAACRASSALRRSAG